MNELTKEQINQCWDSHPSGYGRSRYDIAHAIIQADRAQRQAGQERTYISPVRTVADLANNLLTMDQTLPIYGAQYIDHPTRGRCAIAVSPTLSRERVKDERWIGAGDELNAAVVWTRAPQPAAQPAVERKPLTDAQLEQIAIEDEFVLFCDVDDFIQIARAIEQAHGIGMAQAEPS